MKNSLIISSLFCLVGQGLNAQLTPFQEDGKWGYTNDQQEIIIPPQYDFAEPFKDGKAKVGKLGNRVWWDGWHQRDSYGVIDESGHEIVPLIYTALEFQRDGLIKVRQTPKNDAGEYSFDPDDDGRMNDDRWGYINARNTVIVPINYEYLGNFFEDDPAGQLVFGGIDYYHWGVINREGIEVVPCTLSEKPKKPYRTEGFFYIKRDKKEGIVDANGKIIVEPKYDNVSAQNVGSFIWIMDEKLHGILDWEGNVVVPLEYDQVQPGSNKLQFRVKKNDEFQLINAYEDKPFTLGYSEMDRVEHEWYRITKNEKHGLLNAAGEEIFPPEYEGIMLYADGKVRIQKDELFGLSDTNKRALIAPKYKTLYYSGFGYSFVSDKFHVIPRIDYPADFIPADFSIVNEKGKKLLRAGKYDDFVAFNSDFVWGQSEAKWYLISLKNGRRFIKDGFKDIRNLNRSEYAGHIIKIEDLTQEERMVGIELSTVTVVQQDSLLGAVNQQGKQILPCEYDRIDAEYDRVRVNKDNLWGIFKASGEELIPLKYGYLSDFRNQYGGGDAIEAKFWNVDQETGGYVDLEGVERPW